MKTLLAASACMAMMSGMLTHAGAADTPGIAVGKKAPTFKLKDQKGKEQSLDELLKKHNVAIVFYRSADW